MQKVDNPTQSVSAMVGKPKLLPKYVILDVEGIPTPVLFPAHVVHEHMADGVSSYVPATLEVISAGFYEAKPGLVPYGPKHVRTEIVVTVSGHSESLGVSHRPEDAEIIRTHLLGGK